MSKYASSPAPQLMVHSLAFFFSPLEELSPLKIGRGSDSALEDKTKTKLDEIRAFG